MKITRTIAAAGAAGVLGLTGVVVAVAPALAATDDAAGLDDRATAIVQALAGLVTDGTLTQDQADAVATTLEDSDALRGPGQGGPGGGPGHGLGPDLAAAATALGMTEDDLRTALDVDGTTLADVAAAQGVPTQTLVDALVAARTEHLQAEVADGRITQEQADERIAALPGRLAAMVEEELPAPGGRGPRGGPPADGTTPDDAPTDAPTTDGTTPSPAAAA